MMTPSRTYVAATDPEKKRIAEAFDALVIALAEEIGLCVEAVANCAFFRIQKHPVWGRNATRAQKQAAHKHWNKLCYKCGKRVEYDDAKFHHLARGVPGQRGPVNLVPEHEKCHDQEHNVTKGSLSKGSPRKKPKKRASGG